MPPLSNARWEAFCHEYIRKKGNASAAYTTVYGRTGRTAEVNGSNLLKSTEVELRLAELSAPRERKARVTAARLLSEMELTIADARRNRQHGATVSAATLMARLSGLLVDKLEIGGAGAFDACESLAQVADRLLDDFDDDLDAALQSNDRLRQAIIDRAAERAKPVGPLFETGGHDDLTS